MPTSIVSSECMQFINDQCPYTAKQIAMVDFGRDKHRLKRFRRRQEKLWRIAQYFPPYSTCNIAVPHSSSDSNKRCISFKSGFEIIEQRLKWTNIESG